MTMNPLVFVGASSEAVDHDRAVRCHLERLGARVLSWRDVFHVGDYTLEALLSTARQVDAALLIATPDDKRWYRSSEQMVPRDNVLLELGLFLSALGRQRVGLVWTSSCGAKPPVLPTDLLGLTLLKFEAGMDASNESALQRWYRGLGTSVHSAMSGHVSAMTSLLGGTPSEWHPLLVRWVLPSLQRTAASASRGRIPLTEGQYYQLIHEEMDSANCETRVSAVAQDSPARWHKDASQKTYIEKNFSAAKRGATIRRLFAFPESVPDVVMSTVQRMANAGNFAIRWVSRDARPELRGIEDMVAFQDDGPIRTRIYISKIDMEFPLRVVSAEFIVDESACNELMQIFEQIWITAPPIVSQARASAKASRRVGQR